ncbi:MAG TPA: DNA polymerase III subunit beta [Paenalcaligenes sp.]|nr:DNA polymerase III subunit beta [Paenalcaligenes sp.]
MQLVQATRDALLKTLSTVVGIVERRHTLPILANVLIAKEGEQVSFLANDMEMQISTEADFGVGPESVATTVAARKLFDILRALPDFDEVSLRLHDNKLIVQSAQSRFALQTMEAGDYPRLTAPEQWSTTVTMGQKQLKGLLNTVYFSMAQQDIRYYLNGMLFVIEPGWLRTVATDGHRLAHNAAAIEGVEQQSEVIVPRKTALELQRLLSDDEDEQIEISVTDGQMRCRFSGVELITKLVEGKFPDYSRVIPQNYSRHFNLDRARFQGSLQRAAILTSDKFRGIRVQLENNHMKVSATNAEQEEVREELEVEYAHEPLDVGFNVNYLLDVLSNVRSEEIRWSVHPDANASVLITLPEEESFKYVVMPMRI